MPSSTRVFLAVLFTVLFPGRITAQTIPTGGQSLVSVSDVATLGSFYGGSSGGGVIAARTIVSVSGQPFAQAAQFDVQHPTGNYWDSAVYASSSRAIAVNDVVLVHFFMRAIQTTDETGAVFCQIFAQGPGPNYTKSISQVVSAGPQWIEYFLPFKVTEAAASGDFQFDFGFGAATRPQILQIGGAEMIWYGTARTLDEMPRTSFQYEGRAPDAAWRVDAARRIERYRKGGYELRVVNANGLPVPDAQVHVKLKRHAFSFGCAWVASRILDQSNTDNQNYRAKLLELFNAGSTENDLKWPPWIGEWGAGYGAAPTLTALQWMQTNANFHLRGHVLVWPSVRNSPNFLGPLITASDPTVPQLVLDHITEEVTATKDLLPEWDVLNEPYDNHDIMDHYGNVVMPDWFKTARLNNPTARLYINDYAIISGGGLNTVKQDAYATTVHYLLDHGAPVDGMGFQGHFDAGPTGMSKAWSIMERYANEFPTLEFKITEFDVDTDDEQLQADYLRDFLTLVFSHPRFKGFQVWGYWEGAHWKPRAAMVRLNWEEKANAAVWRALVLNQWQTDESRTTGVDGRVLGRGFLGDYDVTVTVGGQTATVAKSIDANGLVSDLVVNVAEDGAPRITVQPTGATVLPGDPVTLRFEAAGNPAPTLLWFKNDVAMTGETSSTLSIASAASSDEATYYAEATNAAGTARTRPVKLGVRTLDARSEKLINISTRGQVLTGGSIMIAGFVIDGTGPKDVLLRGIGPKLALFGVTGTLPNPRLRLFASGNTTPIATNDDWDPALAPVFAQVGAFGLDGDTLSAAIRASLAPGAYTVQLSGEDNRTGVAIVEAYDVAAGEPLKLINISTRGEVGQGDNNLIAGFVVQGSVPQRVLIRGIGPQLAVFGVGGTLVDPWISLKEGLPGGGSRLIATNDDWSLGNDVDAIKAAAARVGAFGLEDFSRDACVLLSLEPGSYTVQLGGAGTGIGVALIEVYAVP